MSGNGLGDTHNRRPDPPGLVDRNLENVQSSHLWQRLRRPPSGTGMPCRMVNLGTCNPASIRPSPRPYVANYAEKAGADLPCAGGTSHLHSAASSLYTLSSIGDYNTVIASV